MTQLRLYFSKRYHLAACNVSKWVKGALPYLSGFRVEWTEWWLFYFCFLSAGIIGLCPLARVKRSVYKRTLIHLLCVGLNVPWGSYGSQRTAPSPTESSHPRELLRNIQIRLVKGKNCLKRLTGIFVHACMCACVCMHQCAQEEAWRRATHAILLFTYSVKQGLSLNPGFHFLSEVGN